MTIDKSSTTLYTIEGPSAEYPEQEGETAATLSESAATVLERWAETALDRAESSAEPADNR